MLNQRHTTLSRYSIRLPHLTPSSCSRSNLSTFRGMSMGKFLPYHPIHCARQIKEVIVALLQPLVDIIINPRLINLRRDDRGRLLGRAQQLTRQNLPLSSAKFAINHSPRKETRNVTPNQAAAKTRLPASSSAANFATDDSIGMTRLSIIRNRNPLAQLENLTALRIAGGAHTVSS